MLAKQGILTEDERDQIIAGIEGILSDVERGVLEISDKYEDIHSFVEATLIDRIGEPGKKLHTGRSRNDQVEMCIRDRVYMILLADTVGDGAVTKEVTEATSEAVQEVGKFAEYVNDNIPELIGFVKSV